MVVEGRLGARGSSWAARADVLTPGIWTEHWCWLHARGVDDALAASPGLAPLARLGAMPLFVSAGRAEGLADDVRAFAARARASAAARGGYAGWALFDWHGGVHNWPLFYPLGLASVARANRAAAAATAAMLARDARVGGGGGVVLETEAELERALADYL